MSTRVILEIFGWIGSGLIVISLAQARVWRFRVMNFIGAFIATFYNAFLSIWPFAAMNLVITVIDGYWLIRLNRERNVASEAYELVEVDHDDPYLQHFLKLHAEQTKHHFPDFDRSQPSRSSILVMRGDETVGVVAISDIADGTANVSLDYVTERFRDFSPGKYVYEDSGLFQRLGVHRIRAPKARDEQYLRKMGFQQQDGAWLRDVRA